MTVDKSSMQVLAVANGEYRFEPGGLLKISYGGELHEVPIGFQSRGLRPGMPAVITREDGSHVFLVPLTFANKYMVVEIGEELFFFDYDEFERRRDKSLALGVSQVEG